MQKSWLASLLQASWLATRSWRCEMFFCETYRENQMTLHLKFHIKHHEFRNLQKPNLNCKSSSGKQAFKPIAKNRKLHITRKKRLLKKVFFEIFA